MLLMSSSCVAPQASKSNNTRPEPDREKIAVTEETDVENVGGDDSIVNETPEIFDESDDSDGEQITQDSPDSSEELHYKGYRCTVDCSGHEAGYEWAEEKGISDPDDCGGNSQSFIEGCRSYAEDN